MILHIDLDAFFASVEQRDDPKLRGKPVVVSGSLGLRGVVSTASYEARKFGIHSGMPLFRAVRLCPQAILVPVNFAKYEKASNEFHDICAAYSPIIEQTSLDELYMDLEGTDKLWESPRWVAEQIQKRVYTEIGITCSVGISAQKILAKILSGFKKPSGISEVGPCREKDFLAPLPIKEVPGCGHQTQKFLTKLGMKTVGDLANMSREHIKILLGKHGDYLWHVANGKDRSQVTAPGDAKSTSRSTTFPSDSNDKKFIEGMLLYLVERVAKDLRDSGTLGKCISATVRSAEFVTTSMQFTTPYPVCTSHEIFKVSRDLLYKLWDGNTKLRLIGVGVSSLSGGVEKQFQLFAIDEGGRDKWLRIEKAIDRARNKHGFLSITPASILKLRDVY